MSVKKNLEYFNNKLKNTDCTLIAVTKTHAPELIMEAYKAGCKIYGENKVQELVTKHEAMPKDIEWHMIGHLQSNKVKLITPFIYLIHSVDSTSLLKEINKQGQKAGRKINCLLQIHIAAEETKFGFSEKEAMALIDSNEFSGMTNISIIGLMGMATNTDDKEQIRKEFRGLKKIFERIKEDYHVQNLAMKELSMGMSSDYDIAIEEGSTMIRVGSAIFGKRE
ncbi:MAG TPA: YggS family pyridoxal phosphate-dependent enzyme [Cytophagaceae bacterium]|jgi:pyridoxal phosphate enzyme (YggS family)|nr:YggS family pyridoxal phosphate-dependent enzyme [Cytophagaceae bacterium]